MKGYAMIQPVHVTVQSATIGLPVTVSELHGVQHEDYKHCEEAS